MHNYKYLIFDVDDTLLDFYPAFTTAQRNIAEKLGMEPSKEYLETDEITPPTWRIRVESGFPASFVHFRHFPAASASEALP